MPDEEFHSFGRPFQLFVSPESVAHACKRYSREKAFLKKPIVTFEVALRELTFFRHKSWKCNKRLFARTIQLENEKKNN